MIAPPNTLRLSAQERAWLVWLKGKTGCTTFATVLRFALALSLREPSPPGVQPLPTDGLEIDWLTLGGQYREIYWALVLERTRQHGLPADDARAQLRAHLHRGLGALRVTVHDRAGLLRAVMRGAA